MPDSKVKTVRVVAIVTPSRRVECYGLLEESTQKRVLLPTTEVEGGFPVAQFSRVLPREGTLTIVLSDDLPVFEGDIARSKERQKRALDLVFDLEASKEVASLASDMEAIPACVVESINYRRDRRDSVIAAEVRWKEVRVIKTADLTVPLIGGKDPATQLIGDTPPLYQGHLVMGERNTSAKDATGKAVTVQTKQSRSAWTKTWGQP